MGKLVMLWTPLFHMKDEGIFRGKAVYADLRALRADTEEAIEYLRRRSMLHVPANQDARVAGGPFTIEEYSHFAIVSAGTGYRSKGD